MTILPSRNESPLASNNNAGNMMARRGIHPSVHPVHSHYDPYGATTTNSNSNNTAHIDHHSYDDGTGDPSQIIPQKLQELQTAVCHRVLFDEVRIFSEQQKRCCDMESNQIRSQYQQRHPQNRSRYGESKATLASMTRDDAGSKKDTKKQKNNASLDHSHKRQRTATGDTAKNQTEKNTHQSTNNVKTWTDIVQELSQFVSFMTQKEHQLACKLISLCLLSYLAPHSTYAFTKSSTTSTTDYNYHPHHHQHPNTTATLEQLASLEEIMNDIVQYYHRTLSSVQHHPLVIQHEQLSMSFWNFLYNALRPFLSSRPLRPMIYLPSMIPNDNYVPSSSSSSSDSNSNSRRNDPTSHVITKTNHGRTQTNLSNYEHCGTDDLLHLLAMAISPENINAAQDDEDEEGGLRAQQQQHQQQQHQNDMYSLRTKHFMSITKPLYFELSYSQRADIVNVLSQSLVLAEIEDAQVGVDAEVEMGAGVDPSATKPVQMLGDGGGGIAHLRTSLQTFYTYGALSNHHRIDAKRVLNNIAIDTGIFVTEELKSLIQQLVNGKGDSGNPHVNNGVDDSNGIVSTSKRNIKCNTKTTATANTVICLCRNSSKNKGIQQQQQRFIYSYNDSSSTTTTFHKSKLISIQQRRERYERDRHPICIHCATGSLLKDLILRYNGARHYADGIFTRQALAELTGAIATILGMMEQQQQGNDEDITLPLSCVVASLLDAATSLFYFLFGQGGTTNEDTTTDLDQDQLIENGMKEALFECSIQLMRSPNQCIISSASSLLAVGFSYYTSTTNSNDRQQESIQRFIVNIFQTIQSQLRMINKSWKYHVFQDIVKISSRISSSFAHSLLSYLVHKISAKEFEDEKEQEEILSFITSISRMNPMVALQNLGKLMMIYQNIDANELSIKCKRELISVFFICGLSRILPDKDWLLHSKFACDVLLNSLSDGWSLYILTKQAFCTGNFHIAAEAILQKKLLHKMSSTSKSHLWFTTLSMIAESESELSKKGSIAIPTSLISINAAINTLQSVATVSSCSTSFQDELLCCRKDFLQLCLTVRAICAEMRLTNSEGGRNSRIQTHQKNIPKCFYMLASQYSKLYIRYGAIHCQQTRSMLRSYFALCRFLGDTGGKIFCKTSQFSLHESHNKRSLMWPKGDKHNIQCTLATKLHKGLIEKIDESIKPNHRAESMMEIIDLICKCPNPYPRGFFMLRSFSPIKLTITAEPSESVSRHSKNERKKEQEENILKIQAGSPFAVFVSGVIPESYVKKVRLPFSQIVIYMSIVYDGLASNNDDDVDENSDNQIDIDLNEEKKEFIEFPSDLLPVCEHINNDGEIIIGSKFSIPITCEPLVKEGYHFMEIKLFLRENRGGEYFIPITEDSEGIMISCSSY